MYSRFNPGVLKMRKIDFCLQVVNKYWFESLQFFR